MIIKARDLKVGMDIIKDGRKYHVRSVTPCGQFGQKVHVNSVGCYDGQAEVEVKDV